jgi:hypothetical protein
VSQFEQVLGMGLIGMETVGFLMGLPRAVRLLIQRSQRCGPKPIYACDGCVEEYEGYST